MASPVAPLAEKTFPVSKSLSLGGKTILTAGAEITVIADKEVIAVFAANGRLPLEMDPVRLLQTSLSVDTGERKIAFDSGRGEVTFSAGAGAHAGLGVYVSPQQMLQDIAELSGEGDQRIPLDEIPFPSIGAQRFFAFYWGYDVHASGSGSVALAPGAAITFGAQGARNRAFAVIQAYSQNPNAGTAVRKLLNNAWRLPSQISSSDDLDPGTWVLAEVAGSFSANLGLQWGFDYNWIRSVKIDAKEVLQGDVGLKIQAGVNAAFGVSASGRYVVIVGRESLDPERKVVRVRLQRLKQRGWSMAFHADLDLTTTTGTLLPAQLDDFIAATLGVHGLQALQEVRRFVDPSRRLSDLASEFLTDYARNQLGESFEQAFESVHAKVEAWFTKWDQLPAKASSALWDAARLPKAQVTKFVKQLRSFADPATAGGGIL